MIAAAMNCFVSLHNAQALPWAVVPVLDFAVFRGAVIDRVNGGGRLAALLVCPHDGRLLMVAVIADDAGGHLDVSAAPVTADRYPALTPELPAAHAFEREIAEQWQLLPEGHPWLKPLRFQPPLRRLAAGSPSCFPASVAPGDADFFRVEGEQIHEVAVGPVHAGVIEPGHFRFQCYGEKILHLETALGYQHRGIERHLTGGPGLRSIHYLETAAGDTTVGHTLAYCQAVEALAGIAAPPRAAALRALLLELERLANHTGDLGAMAGDVAYQPTSSYCGRLRGEFLNLTALLCGNRFGRNIIRPGGVAFDVDEARLRTLTERFDRTFRGTAEAIELLWNSASVLARFESTGRVDRETARRLGAVGMTARCCGIEADVRSDHPAGIFRFTQLPISVCGNGDVLARAQVRWLEMQRSRDFIGELLEALPETPISLRVGELRPDMLTVSLTEGWRGEICHVVSTDDRGRFAHYKIIDPSFHNWPVLAVTLRNEEISNFPLCNKSFNLSYCGHDL